MQEVVIKLYLECEKARANGVLIKKVSSSDKEFHFQNWVEERLIDLGLNFDEPKRNTYPDFRLVNHPIGFEVKGLGWPGREASYDSNSQVPTGLHNGRSIYYVFGRYPSNVSNLDAYPVTDLVICHGSFLNADTEYVHQNKSFRGFGSYGDIQVRDRKMYVVPTPFFLALGTTGLSTLILPEDQQITTNELVQVGELERQEVTKIVSSYEFNLQTNKLSKHHMDNPHAGSIHRFFAYRSRGIGEQSRVVMNPKALGAE